MSEDVAKRSDGTQLALRSIQKLKFARAAQITESGITDIFFFVDLLRVVLKSINEEAAYYQQEIQHEGSRATSHDTADYRQSAVRVSAGPDIDAPEPGPQLSHGKFVTSDATNDPNDHQASRVK